MKVSESNKRIDQVDKILSDTILDAMIADADLTPYEIVQALVRIMVRYTKYLHRTERRRKKT